MDAPKLERRFSEFRAEGRTLTGTAIRYGEVADLPGWRERFEARAFDLAEADAILNVMHDRARPLARSGGGLTLTDSQAALQVRADLPGTREADDALELVRARVLRGFSLEFVATDERMEGDIRIIEGALLRGLAVVDRPAYVGSNVDARWLWRPEPPAGTVRVPRPRARRVWL